MVERSVPALPEWICRCLRVRSDLRLRLGSDLTDRSSVLAPSQRLGSGDSRLLALHALDETSKVRRSVHLRITPLDLTPGPRAVAGLGRWHQEWRDLHSLARPREGFVKPSWIAPGAGAPPPVLPPIFFCKEKAQWIGAICPECTGPGETDDRPSRCPACGSPGHESSARPSDLDPLKVLAKRLGGGGEAIAAAGSDVAVVIPCVACDRRDRCFPATEAKGGSGTAAEVLIPISTRPFGGVLIEPVHLPWTAWIRLVSGEPWTTVRRSLKRWPAAWLGEVDTRLASGPLFLTGPPHGDGFLLESLLLRCEALRQLLKGLRDLVSDLRHPHLAVRPERLWVQLPPGSFVRPVLWGARVQLLDLAPAWTPDAGGRASAVYLPPPDRPSALNPPGCATRDRWFDGVCIPRAGGAASRPRQGTDMSFLPEEPIEKPLVKGEVVCLVPSGAGRTGAQLAWGRVEICFPEFCSILIEAGQRGPSWLRAFLDEKSGNLPARMGLLRDHALVDDLYALGMLWLAALLRDPGDLEGAERLRDHLAEAIREGELAPGQTATMKKLVHASAQDRPMRLPPLELVDSRLPEEILGAVLHLGARLCGLFSPGYSGQSHEPVSRDQRTSVYASMLDDAAALVERLRDDLLGIPGGTGDLLRALEVFASSRGETYGGGDG